MYYKKCVTQNGTPVSWYRAIQDISYTGNCFFIAHEFFDALPVHQFQVTLPNIAISKGAYSTEGA